jgi:hypothetical protein
VLWSPTQAKTGPEWGTQLLSLMEKTAGPSATPDFLSKAIASVDFMLLSLRRAAYVAAGRAVK